MKPLFALALSACFLPAMISAQSGLSLGEPLNGESAESAESSEPQIGDTVVRETHGDWEIRCTLVAENDEFCHMFQLLTDESGEAFASMRIAPLDDGEDGPAVAAGEITAPLESLLQAGVTLAVDGNNARRYPYAFCSEIGCHARIGFTAEDLAAFRAGNATQVEIFPFAAPDAPVGLTASLTGFTAGFAALSAAE